MAQKGLCAITKRYLKPSEMECHHKIPTSSGGDDSYKNLTIIHKNTHKLIHAVNEETINKYLNTLELNKVQLKKVNELRVKAGNNII